MAEDQRLPKSFARNVLPWVICGAALLVYIIGLQPWVTLGSLASLSKILGWDFWSPNLQAPLYFLVTLPVRWVPLAWQVSALNLFSAFCAAATLGILARCVTLLPQDRTTYQRMRNRHELPGGLLGGRSAWVPPVVACALLGLQLTFWENAVAASVESFNALLFAILVCSVLEYRITRKTGIVYFIALMSGFAMANNWAMLDFFPVLLASMIWIGKGALVRWRVVLTAFALGLLGLLPILLLPALQASQDWHGQGFGESLKMALGNYKMAMIRSKGWLLCPLPAMAAMLWMSLRWSTHSGEVSGLSLRLSSAMHQCMPLMLLAVNVIFLFDTPTSPRELMPHLTFLPVYFLGALAVGYFAGYYQLLGSGGGESGRRRPGALGVFGEKLAMIIAWGSLLLPVGLALSNAPSLAAMKQSPLRQLAEHLGTNLPDKPSVVLGDTSLLVLLAEADYHRRGKAFPHAPVSTPSLVSAGYHRLLASRYPSLWKDNFAGKAVDGNLPPLAILNTLADQAQRSDLYYLHPSFGYYFEVFYPQPSGMTSKLQLYKPKMIGPPELSAQEMAGNQAFWTTLKPPTWAMPKAKSKRVTDGLIAGQIYSRAANEWGVHQQRANHFPEAHQAFELALSLYPSNSAASLNLAVNTELQAGRSAVIDKVQSAEEAFGVGRGWQEALNEFGSYDEPRLCYSLGVIFSSTGLSRQAAILFGRARTLDATNAVYHLSEAEMFLKGRMPERTIDTVQRLKAKGWLESTTMTNQVLAARLEAMAYIAMTNSAAATQAIESATARTGRTPFMLEILPEVYQSAGNLKEALRAVEDQLKMDPGLERKVIQKAMLLSQLKEHAKAIAALGPALEKNPANGGALELRAYNQIELGQFDGARTDYTSLQKLQPASAAPAIGLGEIALRQKQFGEARAHFEQALKLAPAGSREAALARQKLDSVKSAVP